MVRFVTLPMAKNTQQVLSKLQYAKIPITTKFVHTFTSPSSSSLILTTARLSTFVKCCKLLIDIFVQQNLLNRFTRIRFSGVSKGREVEGKMAPQGRQVFPCLRQREETLFLSPLNGICGLFPTWPWSIFVDFWGVFGRLFGFYRHVGYYNSNTLKEGEEWSSQ